MNIQQFNYILALVKLKHFEAAADACATWVEATHEQEAGECDVQLEGECG